LNVAVGTDHRGLEFKKSVIRILTAMGHDCKDFGAYNTNPVDYPDIAQEVGCAVAKTEYDYGILICGTGIGMSIAANKIKKIRAALCIDAFSAQRARLHNDANILCLGAERGEAALEEILATFLNTPFEGGRHQRRLDKIRKLEDQV